MFNLFLRSACVRSSRRKQTHTALCDLNSPLRQAWLFLSHRKTSAGSWWFYKIVIIFIFIDLCKKNIPGDQASLETGLDENDASIANIVRLLKFIPGKTFYEIGCKSWSAASKMNTLFRSPLFWLTHKRAGTTEFVAINMNINWNVQKEKYIKVINISKILRNMDNRPFHAVWRVHCQDG